MKKWMYLIALAMVIITTGCNTMYGVDDPAVESEWPWETVSPESQGIRSEDLARMVEHIEDENLAIHSIIIYKEGTIPFDMYFDPYNESVSHNLKSTSKGVISALVGIALREGYIESLDESVFLYFPEYEVSDTACTRPLSASESYREF